MHASTWRRGLTLPRAAAAVSDSTYCASALGTLLMRVAMTAHCVGGVGGHQVEDAADALDGRGDDVQRHLVQARGVDLLGQGQPLLHAPTRSPGRCRRPGTPAPARPASGGAGPSGRRGRPGRSRRGPRRGRGCPCRSRRWGSARPWRPGRRRRSGRRRSGGAGWQRQWWRSPAQRTRAPGVRRRDCERCPRPWAAGRSAGEGRGPPAGRSGGHRCPHQPPAVGPRRHRRRRRGVGVGARPGRGEHGDEGRQLLGGGPAADQAQRRESAAAGSGGVVGVSLTAGCSRASSAAGSRAWCAAPAAPG